VHTTTLFQEQWSVEEHIVRKVALVTVQSKDGEEGGEGKGNSFFLPYWELNSRHCA
jgi:hypothetical protein